MSWNWLIRGIVDCSGRYFLSLYLEGIRSTYRPYWTRSVDGYYNLREPEFQKTEIYWRMDLILGTIEFQNWPWLKSSLTTESKTGFDLDIYMVRTTDICP